MAKKKNLFSCTACGEEFSKWMGRCPACGEWNTVVEAVIPSKPAPGGSAVIRLSAVETESARRLTTGITEFDLVCGGGLVPGSVILVGGEPGIGKSTLALQVAGRFRSLYISGEESPAQLRQRADRLGIRSDAISVSSTTTVGEIQQMIESEKPQCVIIDSVQTLYIPEAGGIAGSVSQIREATSRLADTAKALSVPLIIIGHITKDGLIAGPKMLEHLVDTVLYFEGDFSRDYRILRSFKNRYGSVNEIGLFRMTEKGLVEIEDRNGIFLNPFDSKSPGSAVTAAIEGSRVILFEVQSLVTFTSFSNPRRMSDGFDLNRAILISAVLEKHASLKLSSFDVFINVAGGFQISETAADLAVAVAIASSLREKPVKGSIGFLGEISLSGEIRPVSQCQRRLQELVRSGFSGVCLSRKDAAEARQSNFTGNIIEVQTIAEVIERIFGE